MCGLQFFIYGYENYNLKSINLFYLLPFMMAEANKINSKKVTTFKKYWSANN